ncbi:MAG: inositol monophosphatase family protein [Dehalococcoidia bacterium]
MSFEQELRAAVEAARAAGVEVARMRQEGLRFGRKGGRELVSEADIRAAEMLYSALHGAFPDDGWLSEEHVDTAHRLRQDRVWIVDPIDGTREYLSGVPEYAISVGLVVAGAPVLGVVYNPAKDELHAAVVGAEGQAAAASAHLKAQHDILVGRGEQEWDDIPPLPAGSKTRGVGSVAYRLALIAAGKGDAVITGYGRSEWDVAAGAAICQAAGITVTDVLGEPLRFNQPSPSVRGLLVAAPKLHAHLLGHLRRYLR